MNYQPRALRTDWIGIGIFFAVAALWSWAAAHFAVLAWPGSGEPPRFDNSIVAGFGPAVGGLVASLTRPGHGHGFGAFAGRSKLAASAALLAPVVSLAIAGLAARGWNAHLSGAIFALSVTIYAIGEELGWRGWLRTALSSLPSGTAIVVTAALWYAWHWTFLAEQLRQPQFGLGFAAGIVLGSWGLHLAAGRSGGTAIPAAWHAASKAMGLPLQIAAMVIALAWATWQSGRSEQPRA